MRQPALLELDNRNSVDYTAKALTQELLQHCKAVVEHPPDDHGHVSRRLAFGKPTEDLWPLGVCRHGDEEGRLAIDATESQGICYPLRRPRAAAKEGAREDAGEGALQLHLIIVLLLRVLLLPCCEHLPSLAGLALPEVLQPL